MKQWIVILTFSEPSALSGPRRERWRIAVDESALSPTFSVQEQRSIISEFDQVSPKPVKVTFDRRSNESPSYLREFISFCIIDAETEFQAQTIGSDIVHQCQGFFANLQLTITRMLVRERNEHTI